jgi:membrane peptidoglycan carboxypeptidase
MAALKTGTTNDLLDFSTYGLLPKPRNKKQPALAIGVWFGNSDHSRPTVPASNPIYSSDNAGEAWHAFVRDYMRGKPTATFKRPKKGIVAATIDKYSGGAPGPWTRGTMTELFIKGTQPGGKRQVDEAGLIYSRGCGSFWVQPARAENPGAPDSWYAAVNAWASKGGLGTSQWGTRGTYFGMAGKNSFGGPVGPGTNCSGPASTDKDEDKTKVGSSSSSTGGGSSNPVPCKAGTTNKPPGCVVVLE